jgi:hypothetical protein
VISMKRVLINFPFSGYKKGDPREELFWRIVETCSRVEAKPIIVVISKDTLAKEGGEYADAFLHDSRVAQYGLYVHETWSIDTCQSWLVGWGVALGMLPCTSPKGDPPRVLPEPDPDEDRIVLLPGDIDAVAHPHSNDFFNTLRGFLNMGGFDIVVGDFETGEKLAPKDLIDLYGTYPLLAVWFPEIASATRDETIWKPRSEFLNVRAGALKELLLNKRKFAYEQTLNILIQSWDFTTHTWTYPVGGYPLGVFADDPNSRDVSGAIDQIERTERMLKMLWREFRFSEARDMARDLARDKADKAKKDAEASATDAQYGQGHEVPEEVYKRIYEEVYKRIYREESAEILRQYDRLESTSRAIEAAARVTVLSFIAQ